MAEKIDYAFAENPTKLKQAIDAVLLRGEKATTENVKADYIKRAGKLAKGFEIDSNDEDGDDFDGFNVEEANAKELKAFAKSKNINIVGMKDVEEIRALVKSSL